MIQTRLLFLEVFAAMEYGLVIRLNSSKRGRERIIKEPNFE